MVGEKYYLRILLIVVRGAIFYESLYTVHLVVHTTFEAPCIAYGLLEDDEKWAQCSEEAAQFSSGRLLRTLFATTLLFGNITRPLNLWQQFCTSICEDLNYALEHSEALQVPQGLHDADLDYGLYLTSLVLPGDGQTLQDFELPNYPNDWGRAAGNELIATKHNYDLIEQIAEHDLALAQLNKGQGNACTTILHSIVDGSHHYTLFKHQLVLVRIVFIRFYAITFGLKGQLFFLLLPLELQHC